MTCSPLEVRVRHPLNLEAALLDMFRKWSGENEGDQGEEEKGLEKRRHIEN